MPVDVSGFIPDTTPNQGLYKLADTIREDTRYKQEKEYQRNKEKAAKVQQNTMFNLREIKDETDFSKYKTTYEALDDISRKELKRISDKALTEYVGLDPVEARVKLDNETKDFFGWHTSVTSKLKQADSNLPDFNKTYPNIDYEEAKRRVHNNIIQDFIDPKTGEKKAPANLERDYVKELHDPNVIAAMTNDFSPIDKYFNSGLKPFSNTDFTSIRGVKNRERYSGLYKPGINQVVADESGKPILETNFEIAPGASKEGKPLKIIDENTYQNILNTPGLAGAFLNKFKTDRSAEGEQKLDEYYIKKSGKPMDAITRENAYRHWLYLNHNENLAPNISPDKRVEVPRIYNTTNIGGGDKGAAKADANKWLTDTDAAIKTKDINSINEQFRILERGGRFVDVNAKYDKDGNIVVTYLTPVTDGDNKLIQRTFKNDANLANQLKGVYQSMTGEDKVFEYSKTDTPKPAGGKKVYNPKTGKFE